MQGGLKINPMALMPGAGPPSQANDDKAVTFEDPPKVETLQSLTKVREHFMRENNSMILLGYIRV